MTEPQPLGRVLDPDELARDGGPRGRLRVEVPSAWLAGGDTVEIAVPARVTCGRCDGGGCDGCDRSGAIRLVGDESARTLVLPLVGIAAHADEGPKVVRLVRPLGDDAGLDQLWIELHAAPEASAFCRRQAPSEKVEAALAPTPSGDSTTWWVIALVVIVALVLAAVVGR